MLWDRKSLIKCMRNLMRRRSFSSISITDICDLAGISRRSFYRYYPDKYALLEYIYDTCFFQKLDTYEGYNIWDYYRQICTQMANDPDFFRHAAEVDGQNGFYACYARLLHTLLEKDLAQTDGEEFDRKYFDILFSHSTDALFEITKMSYASRI
ncbi:MAG: TetR/AcrR family transcriptional regulator [Lachnospiraceae bacterium]|nr:TetR/AcrR family transcriptional regulator [Lachnospiraceae bacterium]